MERITGRDSIGVYYRHGKECGVHNYADRPPLECAEAIDRLAAYEDTGLTPDEISQLLPDGGLPFAIRNRETELQNSRLRAELDAVKRERDAAVETLQWVYERTKPGGIDGGYPYGATTCIGSDIYHEVKKWRGVQEAANEKAAQD